MPIERSWGGRRGRTKERPPSASLAVDRREMRIARLGPGVRASLDPEPGERSWPRSSSPLPRLSPPSSLPRFRPPPRLPPPLSLFLSLSLSLSRDGRVVFLFCLCRAALLSPPPPPPLFLSLSFSVFLCLRAKMVHGRSPSADFAANPARRIDL